MAMQVTPTNLQKVEFDVTTTEGPGRVTIVTGMFDVGMSAAGSSSQAVNQSGSFKAVLDPTLTAGKFRKATAIASFGNIGSWELTPPQSQTEWIIDDAQATYDDEAGRVQLIVDATVSAFGDKTYTTLQRIIFQVTTLAMV